MGYYDWFWNRYGPLRTFKEFFWDWPLINSIVHEIFSSIGYALGVRCTWRYFLPWLITYFKLDNFETFFNSFVGAKHATHALKSAAKN